MDDQALIIKPVGDEFQIVGDQSGYCYASDNDMVSACVQGLIIADRYNLKFEG